MWIINGKASPFLEGRPVGDEPTKLASDQRVLRLYIQHLEGSNPFRLAASRQTFIAHSSLRHGGSSDVRSEGKSYFSEYKSFSLRGRETGRRRADEVGSDQRVLRLLWKNHSIHSSFTSLIQPKMLSRFSNAILFSNLKILKPNFSNVSSLFASASICPGWSW